MNLLEKISQTELQMFDRYRKDYVEEACGSPVSVESILSYWDSAKRVGNLYQLLGDNLMIDKEIVSEKSEYEMENAIDNLLYSRKEFISAWRDFIYKHFIDLKLDIHNEEYQMYYNMDKLMLKDALASNVYKDETFFVTFPNGDKYKVQKGCKVSKALGKIADAFCIPGYEEFRIAHSQILNEKRLAGKMTLSIHPLDYITMSDNDCDWSSCMNWREDGEYRRGTVEMMNSPCVVIAYLNAKDPMPMSNGKYWSNKKWRELFIVNEDCIVGIKGYPYWNRNLEKIALDWIKELAEKNWGYTYTNKEYTLDAPNNGTMLEVEELGTSIRVSLYTDAMYNDCYDMHKCYINKDFCDEKLCLNYSGYSQCMWCGSINVGFSYESNLVCMNCDDELYCSKCGERIYHGDEYWVNGECYCSYCYDELARCDDCHEVVGDDYCINRVHFCKDGKIYKWVYADLCDDCFCYNEHISSSLFKTARVDTWREINYIRAEDLDMDNEEIHNYLDRIFENNDVYEDLTGLPYWIENTEQRCSA